MAVPVHPKGRGNLQFVEIIAGVSHVLSVQDAAAQPLTVSC